MATALRVTVFAGWLAVAVALARPVRAEDPPRRVGSLNYLSGDVSYVLRTEPGEPAAAAPQNWLPADFNQPVCQDMSLKTGALARARVRIGGDAIELSDDTSLNILNLTDRLIEASVSQGRIFLQLATFDPGESVEFETPRGSLWVLQSGAYDIDIGNGDRPTRIVVFDGKARFVGGTADLPIAAGKEIEIGGSYPAVAATLHDWTGIDPTHPAPPPAATGDNIAGASSNPAVEHSSPSPTASGSAPNGAPAIASEDARSAAREGSAPQTAGNPTPRETAAETGGAGSSDPFLYWVAQSNDDQPRQPRQAARYVSAETTGSDDLDRYGTWAKLPDSEPVWFPASVPQDWAPYRFGHWDWIAPWGWTWIDDQPWGFAPFHYGRWVMIDNRWGWVPGTVEPHPVYAPALVAFVDAPDGGEGGPDGGPDVAWFPLGPGDDYVPWYPTDATYVAAINAPAHGHFHDFDRQGAMGRERAVWRTQYFNRRFATVVSRTALADGHRIDRQMVRRMDLARLEGARVMHGAPRITPAVLRSDAATGEFRGGPRGAAAADAVNGLHMRPGEVPAVAHGPAASERAPEHTVGSRERSPGANRQFGGSQGVRGAPQAFRPGPASPPGRSAATQGFRPGTPQQFGRVEAGRESRPGAAPQFGRPAAAQGFRPGAVPQFGQPAAAQGFRPGAAPQFGQPAAAQGFRPGAVPQFGQPAAAQGVRPGAVPQFGRPAATQGFRPGAAPQFGRPVPTQGFRGLPQFGHPQAFQTPAASSRGMGVVGRAPARPVPQTGGATRHK